MSFKKVMEIVKKSKKWKDLSDFCLKQKNLKQTNATKTLFNYFHYSSHCSSHEQELADSGGFHFLENRNKQQYMKSHESTYFKFNDLPWSLAWHVKVCSHDAAVTANDESNGLHCSISPFMVTRPRWQWDILGIGCLDTKDCSHGNQFCRNRCRTVWIRLNAYHIPSSVFLRWDRSVRGCACFSIPSPLKRKKCTVPSSQVCSHALSELIFRIETKCNFSSK